MRRLNVSQVTESPSLAPLRKPAGRFEISPPRVCVANVGGEESEEPLGGFFVRQEQRRELRGQASERARLFVGNDLDAL